MARTNRDRDWNGLATITCVLSFGVVLYLLVPGLASDGAIPAGNLYLAVPFVVVAIFCFQLGLESLAVESPPDRNRTRPE